LLHQQFADLGRAGEGQFADDRVRGQLAADLVLLGTTPQFRIRRNDAS
jgi:hypothetical protein